MNEALRDAWLAEMWAPCRELTRSERAAERDAAAVRNAALSPVDAGLGPVSLLGEVQASDIEEGQPDSARLAQRTTRQPGRSA